MADGYPGMRWAVVSAVSNTAIRLAAAIAKAPRTCTLSWCETYRGTAMNDAVELAYREQAADRVFLLAPGADVTSSARNALLHSTADYVGFSAFYVVDPRGNCRYVRQSPMRSGEPIAAARVLSRAALDRVGGRPFAGLRTPLEQWMTLRLSRYGIRPLVLQETPDRIIWQKVGDVRAYRGEDVALDRVLAAAPLEEIL